MTDQEFSLLANTLGGVEVLQFHVHFRRRGLRLQRRLREGEYDPGIGTRPPTHLLPARIRSAAQAMADELPNRWPEVLARPDSAAILWALYLTTNRDGEPLLCELLPSLGAIRSVYRNGVNLYKLSGWVVHVLVGYTITLNFIPRGTLPGTIPWERNVHDFVLELQTLYAGLSAEARRLLAVAFLAHDIGVRIAIPGHDLHGVPLVAGFLDELGIGADRAADVCPDLAWRVRAIVRFHTLVNRLGVELGEGNVRRQLMQFVASDGEASPDRREFLRNELPVLLTLLGTGDLVAVNDSLLTSEKADGILAGLSSLRAIAAEGEERLGERSSEEVGLRRLLHFLPSSESVRDHRDVARLLPPGCDPHLFLRTIAAVGEIDFGLSLLPRLESNEVAVSLLAAGLDRLRKATNDDVSTGVLRFSPSLRAEEVSAWVAEAPPGALPGRLGLTQEDGGQGIIVMLDESTPPE